MVYSTQLRVRLLLQFIEQLEKLLYNSYEGSGMTISSAPKVKDVILISVPLMLCAVMGTPNGAVFIKLQLLRKQVSFHAYYFTSRPFP